MSAEFVSVRRCVLILSLSFSGISVPLPMLAPFSGSKFFLASFTTSLGEELKGEDTDVGCQLQCVSVVRIPDYLGPGTFAFEIGLVTKKASQDESWLRIGVFRQLRNGTALFGESLENATELTLL